MNISALNKILAEHKVWVESFRQSGSRADLRGANLCGANLCGANLCGANLCGANLCDANLCDANLCGADLCGANLYGANLYGANLCDANLCGANLYGANLCDANLRDANLCDANLCDADLYGANLCGANLCDANLCDANLPDLTFVIMGKEYPITITNGEYVRAVCQNHTVEEWRAFSKQEIAEMDGRKALKFYPHLLDTIDFYLGKGERPEWVSEEAVEVCSD